MWPQLIYLATVAIIVVWGLFLATRAPRLRIQTLDACTAPLWQPALLLVGIILIDWLTLRGARLITTDPTPHTALWIAIAAQIACAVFVALWTYAFQLHRKLRLERPRLLVLVEFFGCCIPVLWLTGYFWENFLQRCHVHLSPQWLVAAYANEPIGWTKMIFAAVATTLVPIVEEWTFRGIIYRLLKAHTSTYLAVVASGVIFATMHFDLCAFGPLFVLGIFLALAYERNGLYGSMLLHATFNAGTFITLHLWL